MVRLTLMRSLPDESLYLPCVSLTCSSPGRRSPCELSLYCTTCGAPPLELDDEYEQHE